MKSTKNLRCGVIGVGYLGRFHAQKYAALANVDLQGVFDINSEQAQKVAQELHVSAYAHLDDFLADVDAVSIAASTQHHYDLAKICLEQGKHVLLEKPMTETLEQADQLIALAKHHHCILQIGHLERFNPARVAIEPYLTQPRFIEATRLAPYTPRGADVNVILDLMIHDLDLIQTMVRSPVVHIDAQGSAILSSSIDIASVRLHFENQCVANLTSSRISFKSERKMRIFQPHQYLSVDYGNKQFAVFKQGSEEMFPGIPNVVKEEFKLDACDALYEEIFAFTQCIRHRSRPLVSGEDGRQALDLAHQITQIIAKQDPNFA